MQAAPVPRFCLNPTARAGLCDGGLFTQADYDSVAAFFNQPPWAAPTPLVALPALAGRLGIRDLLLKDESARFGLDAFKGLGVSYAIHRLVAEGRLRRDAVLVTATTGNHGRAVAHVGRRFGFRVRIYVPSATVAARHDALQAERAEVVIVDGNYDDAVRRAARDAEEYGWTAVSDTAWPGYEEIPRWIMAGYTQLLNEAEREWRVRPSSDSSSALRPSTDRRLAQDRPFDSPPTGGRLAQDKPLDSPSTGGRHAQDRPDVVFVQAGVGGLACATASWLCHRFGGSRPFTIACEPLAAACLLESVRAGRPVTIRGELRTEMAGLRAGEMSAVVWPAILRGIDALVAIDDERVFETMRQLAQPLDGDRAIVSGASGACGLAVLQAVLSEPALAPVREAAGLGSHSRALVINTEGATDPDLYRRIVGQS